MSWWSASSFPFACSLSWSIASSSWRYSQSKQSSDTSETGRKGQSWGWSSPTEKSEQPPRSCHRKISTLKMCPSQITTRIIYFNETKSPTEKSEQPPTARLHLHKSSYEPCPKRILWQETASSWWDILELSELVEIQPPSSCLPALDSLPCISLNQCENNLFNTVYIMLKHPMFNIHCPN